MSEVTIPNEWEDILLGEYVDVIRGASPRPKGDPRYFGGDIPWISIRDVNAEKGRFLSKTAEGVTPAGADKSRLVEVGGLILSNSGSVCIPKILKVEGCIHDGFVTFPNLGDSFCIEYFYHLFDKMRASVIQANRQGVTQVNLNIGIVKAFQIPLPPITEQKEIALRLDDLLAQVDSIKTRLDALPALLKRFRQSTLAHATSGKLTEQWRVKHGNVKWAACYFGDLVEATSNGLAKRRGDVGDDVTVLRLADFKNAKRAYGKERKIRLSQKECDKYLLKEGDLLAIRVNGSADLAGLFILYNEENNKEAYCDHFIRFTLDKDRVDSEYFTYVTNEGDGRRYLRNSLSTSAGQNTINQKSIKAMPVSLPSLEEQTEIVRRVTELFAFADQVEQRVKDAQAHVNHLTQSILAKAFRGELTEEWRTANPALITGKNSAAALLKRIKAEREKLVPKKKTRKK